MFLREHLFLRLFVPCRPADTHLRRRPSFPRPPDSAPFPSPSPSPGASPSLPLPLSPSPGSSASPAPSPSPSRCLLARHEEGEHAQEAGGWQGVACWGVGAQQQASRCRRRCGFHPLSVLLFLPPFAPFFSLSDSSSIFGLTARPFFAALCLVLAPSPSPPCPYPSPRHPWFCFHVLAPCQARTPETVQQPDSVRTLRYVPSFQDPALCPRSPHDSLRFLTRCCAHWTTTAGPALQA
jgi:hypothetical protein